MAYKNLFIDIETFSSVDITKAGLYKYVQSPDFQILLFAYSFDGKPVEIIDLIKGECIPKDIVSALHNPNCIKHAYNAPFEWYCLCKYFNVENPIPLLNQWQCTMVHGLYCGYPAGLEKIGKAIGLPQEKQKFTTGKALIKYFCTPCKPTKSNGGRTRNLPHHEPEKWELFKDYCKQDVVTETEIENRLSAFSVPEQEQKLWQLDQQINTYGVHIDKELIDSALYCIDVITDELTQESINITGLNNPNSDQQLKKWLKEELGQEIPNMQKDTVNELIETVDNSKVKRVLKIRQELSKTSIKKYDAMDASVCEDIRIRGLLQFYGANRTGRWAGRLVQVQNLPRNYLETLSYARELVKNRKIDALKLIYGNIPDTLSQLIRTAFIPSQGNVFLVADFSAIEARVISWLADEKWKNEVFATHGKIYEASASQMFGVPIDTIVKGHENYKLRQQGKIAELGLGYGMGASKFKDTAERQHNVVFTDEEAKNIVNLWRSSNKRIVDFWYGLENAALEVMHTGKTVGIRGLLLAREYDSPTNQDFLTITLPSERKLFYPKPFLGSNDWGKEAIHYYIPVKSAVKWHYTSTWGGKLTENVVQSIARDCLAESMKKLSIAGYQTVMHVHDEVILDVNLEGIEDLGNIMEYVYFVMGEPISWAPGLMLKADGFVSEFYKKD